MVTIFLSHYPSFLRSGGTQKAVDEFWIKFSELTNCESFEQH